MAFWDTLVNFFTPSSDTPAVPLPDGTKTGQLPAQQQTKGVTQATQSKKASASSKAKQTTKAQPETEALLNEKDQKGSKASGAQNTVVQPKATEKTIEAALQDYDDTFGVYNPDGSLNVQATIDEFNVQSAMGLLKEKPRDMKDFSDKRNWDDALKMLANWAPQGPSILFRGQGGNKVYRRN